jgi:cytoskeletal protein RodZ
MGLMPTVAEQLRQAREAQNLTVYQVAETTKIKTDHIRALDEGNYDVFCAPVYIRGFVRTYATVLKLSVPQVMAVLEQELAQTEKFREPPSLSVGSHGFLDSLMFQLSRLDLRIIGSVVGLILVFVVGGWGLRAYQAHKLADPLADLGPGVYAPTNSAPGDTLLLPKNAPAR